MRAAPKARMMTERMIRIMAGAGLVAILSFIWLGQAAAGARTASRHQCLPSPGEKGYRKLQNGLRVAIKT